MKLVMSIQRLQNSTGIRFQGGELMPVGRNRHAAGAWRKIYAAVLFCATTATLASAQATFTNLASFNGINGANPHFVYLVQGSGGNLYGTTYVSTGSGGTVFKVTTAGKLTVLYTFCPHGEPCLDGAQPNGGLVLASNGNFYGNTQNGGANNFGTVFQITSAGKLTTLHSFNETDGAGPDVGLIQARNGQLYGTTAVGGASNFGTIFDISTAGAFTSLHSFNGTDGDFPEGRLVQGQDGNFYGTTTEATGKAGTVFKMTAAGKITTLHKFTGTDGGGPSCALVQASNGNFYGTTSSGGTHGGGTVFQITPAGKLTTLYNFCAKTSCTDGSDPIAGLIQATDGNLYGATFSGGSNKTACNGGCGTLFKITTAGALTTLYNFCAKSGCTDGSAPQEGLVQHTNGKLYGLTYYGGTDNLGTVYSLSVGLNPFVKTVPTSGKAVENVTIVGTNLTGAASVTFNGIPATFVVLSDSEITATIPTGATHGAIAVETPAGTLRSNADFAVTE